MIDRRANGSGHAAVADADASPVDFWLKRCSALLDEALAARTGQHTEDSERTRRRAIRRALLPCVETAATARGLDPSGIGNVLRCPPINGPAGHRDAGPSAPLALIRPEELGTIYQHLLGAGRRRHRKHSGAYYTDGSLTGPTTARCLRPLLVDEHAGVTSPRPPERLLELRVCDPAAGGGAFLIAALRELAAALAEALRTWAWLDEDDRAGPRAPRWFRSWWRSPDGADSTARRLRSLVARRCLFGVDLDRDAVAIARLALWLDVGDPALQVHRLARQVRHGNALIGAWHDRQAGYPTRAFARHAGDRTHAGVHFERGSDTRALRAMHRELDGRGTSEPAPDSVTPLDPDTWCALWFWPPGRLDDAPRPRAAEHAARTMDLVADLARCHAFFHWELEFPRVFARGGFDAVIGNPPWDIRKPCSRDFFARLDNAYRTYEKQAALKAQQRLFASAGGVDIERSWLDHLATSSAFAHWCREGGKPFRRQGTGDPNNYKLFLELGHRLLRDGGRLGMIVPSGLYTDLGAQGLRELFLRESRWRWLFCFENRRSVFDIDCRFKFGPIIVEKGGTTRRVRTAFMRQDPADWRTPQRHALVIERRQIERWSPHSLAFLEVRSARDLAVLERIHGQSRPLGDPSPDGWQVRYRRELDLTLDSHKFASVSDWQACGYRPDRNSRWLRCRRGAARRPAAEPTDWLALRDGSFVHIDDVEDTALPLYEGRMIGQFDFSEKGWVRGRGRQAVWRDIPFPDKTVEPQFLIAARDLDEPACLGHKIGFMAIGSATNRRSMIAASLLAGPCGNSVPVLTCASGTARELALLAVLDSFAYDWALRARLGGVNLNWFVVAETPLPAPDLLAAVPGVVEHAAALSFAHPRFAPAWSGLRGALRRRGRPWQLCWALTPHERTRRRAILDAIVALAYGLELQDLAWILRDCHHPVERLGDRSFTRQLDQKGFWRIDQDRPPELRHPVLALAAFADLAALTTRHAHGFAAAARAFCALNDGEGWLCPAELRLTELFLDADRAAGADRPRPVRERLGPRFLPWQLEASLEDSWQQCERHAARLGTPVRPTV